MMTKKEIEELENEKRNHRIKNKQVNNKYKPKYNEFYYYVNSALNVLGYKNDEFETDRKVIKYNKVFETKEEAQEYADYLKARFEYSCEFSIKELKNYRLKKYTLYYDSYKKIINIDYHTSCININTIFFKTEEIAQEFIDKYNKQILKFEFGIEE